MYKILIVNLGGTSTKVALYEDETPALEVSLRHTDEELSLCADNTAQIAMRKGAIMAWFQENHVDLSGIDAAIFRMINTGGLCTTSGTYCIEGKLQTMLMKIYEQSFPKAAHPGLLAYPLLQELLNGHDVPVYAIDPDDVNEFSEVARVSGLPQFPRTCGIHMINQKAMARKAAAALGKKYQEAKLVVAHLGGGVSIASHENGRIVDSTHAVDEGPFAPTRCGTLSAVAVAKAIAKGELDPVSAIDIMHTKSGFVAHTGLSDIRQVEKKAEEGDANCELVLRAFIYQVCRYIGAQFAALNCEAEAIVLTGGIAYSKRITEAVSACVSKLAPVMIFPGEDESGAMIDRVLKVLRGEEEATPV